MAEELKKLTGRVQNVEGGKGIEGLNYKDLCIQLDVELPEGYKPPKFEMFDGTGDSKVNLRTYCDKLVGVGKDERICMKLFMRRLTGDALSWYISQNPKKWVNWRPSIEYATRWRSEAAKVRPTLEEEQMNKFFVRAQDPQYYEMLMVIENHKFSEIVKLGERIEEGMVTNFEALQATNKALQSGGMRGHTIDECRTLKDKIQTLINNKVIQANEATPNVHNNPLPNHRGEGVNVIEIDEEWDPEGSVGLIREGDDPKTSPVTLTPVMVQTQAPFEVEDYVAEARRKGKTKMEETGAAQGMTRTDRVYTPEHLGGTSKEVASKPHVVDTSPADLWRESSKSFPSFITKLEVQAREYSVVDHLNKTPAQISILSLLQNSETHRNALMKVLSEAYVPTNISSGKMANMVGQVLERHKITFHEDELPPEGLSHNRSLHITVQSEDKFIARVLIDGGSSLNICPLTTLKRLGKGLYEIRMGSMNVKAFDGSQRATIGEINLNLQMGPTWFDVEFQVLDISATYNLLLGRPWIHVVGVVASTLHQAMKFEWNHQEVIIHGDGSNPIYTNQTVPVIENRNKLGGETYHRIERVNSIEKDQCIIITYLDEPVTVTCNETTQHKDSDSEDLEDDTIPEEIVREVKNFKNKPKSNLDETEAVNLGDSELVKETHISIHLSPSEKEEYIRFLKEYEDIFAWSYDDMTGLSISIVAHKLPTNPTCSPVKQKLRKFKSDMSLKIKEEVTKKIKAKVLRVVEYPTWLANIVPVPKKDWKVRNAGATYMRAMTTIFHDMIHKEIEVYVDDVIIKSKRSTDHIANLRKFFNRFRKYNLKLNPAKCAFGVPAGKLLGFIASRRGIELDPSKVKAIQDFPPPKNKKDVMSFLGRLNYISHFIAQSTVTCKLIFKMLRKYAATSWTE
ncbi:uncharacterized protein [Nicotiana tomentosiformis]|uniref:uncharacterized protein n=1 Tax=Nicotiana tomentosiformis TaxID=4098 RepID=UPI00388C8C87